MKRLTKKWFEYAEANLEAADVLLKSGRTHWSDQVCVYHCHQCIEKTLKTVIVEKEGEPKRTHNLIVLLQDTEIQLSEEFKKYIEELNPHYQLPRYPDTPHKGPIFRYNKKVSKYHFDKTKKIFLWIKRSILK
ncbi:MAG: HEPN domain-containing protein [Candidatus Omnitrophica bacterium]|nr:HEPN domain-containing protein [Candidatus Omnitrophota bacterium]